MEMGWYLELFLSKYAQSSLLQDKCKNREFFH